MDKSCASAYVYAKASGMLKNTYVGQNSLPLFNAKSLSEIWELVFKTPVPAMPEVMLATKIEKDANQQFINQFISLVECFDKPSSFFISLMQRYYDLSNLKSIVSALSIGEEFRPHVVRLGPYELLNYEKWPDLKAITENSRFDWINTVPELKETHNLFYKLDVQEFHQLWKDLKKLPKSVREPLQEFFTLDYSLENVVWGLRLKVYYNMSSSEIKKNLYYVTENPDHNDPLCSTVLKILEKPLDSYEEWKDFKYSEFLNPHEEGTVWKIDPLWIEHKIRQERTRKAYQLFHKYPLTEIPLVMFFLLKQQEVNCIRAAVERLRLGANLEDSLYAAGIQN